MKKSLVLSAALWLAMIARGDCGIIDSSVFSNGFRWDAAPAVFDGWERSIDGGIRYSLQGGSYEAFRDRFQWNTLPTVEQFQGAIEHAFAAWTSVDPVSGLGTNLNFIPDLATPVVGGQTFTSINFRGAEIDLFGVDAGGNALRGFTGLQAFPQTVQLTSGVADYPDTAAIVGVDILLNNNPGAVYSLDIFRRLLTHEIGHAIGLADVDLGGLFLDDNFDPLNPVGTLNNSWAHLVNPMDPANSPGLTTFSIPQSTFAVAGVNLLMESNGLGIGLGNPLTELVPLTNDEYGMRQYLYPVVSVPEPSSFLLLLSTLLFFRRKRPQLASQAI